MTEQFFAPWLMGLLLLGIIMVWFGATKGKRPDELNSSIGASIWGAYAFGFAQFFLAQITSRSTHHEFSTKAMVLGLAVLFIAGIGPIVVLAIAADEPQPYRDSLKRLIPFAGRRKGNKPSEEPTSPRDSD